MLFSEKQEAPTSIGGSTFTIKGNKEITHGQFCSLKPFPENQRKRCTLPGRITGAANERNAGNELFQFSFVG
jgi:hypothetical protein